MRSLRSGMGVLFAATQKTFSNQCFASCSGYIIQGECTRTGG